MRTSKTKKTKKVKTLEHEIAILRKANALKTKVIGRCLHRGRIVDEVFDQVATLENELTALRIKHADLEKTLHTFDQETGSKLL